MVIKKRAYPKTTVKQKEQEKGTENSKGTRGQKLNPRRVNGG